MSMSYDQQLLHSKDRGWVRVLLSYFSDHDRYYTRKRLSQGRCVVRTLTQWVNKKCYQCLASESSVVARKAEEHLSSEYGK
jgi:hypothetical protein